MSAVRVRPWHLLIATWLVVIAYAYPGYLNFDSGGQLYQARVGPIEDWHPPIMAAYWKLFELALRGPLLLLLAQTASFLWGLYAILRLRFTPRAAAIGAAALMLFPPILTPMAAVWKDAQVAGFLLGGFALCVQPSWRARAGGLALLLVGAAVRDNAPAALPPLLLFACASWGVARRWHQIAAAAGVCVAIVVAGALLNGAFVGHRTYPWYRSVAIDDLAGTICNSDMSDAEIGDALAGTGRSDRADAREAMCARYSPRVWFSLSDYFVPVPNKEQRLARRAAWWRIVRDHPIAYLEHRADVMAHLLGLTDDEIWEPVCQTINANAPHRDALHHDASLSRFQDALGTGFRALGRTVLYRPWMYALLALIFFAYAFAQKDTLVLAIAGSGLLYELSYAVGASAPDYRYSHWMVTCTALAAVFTARDRYRRRRRA